MQARSSLYITKANAPEIYTTFGNNREQIFRLEGCHLYNRRNFSFGSLPTNLAGMSFLYFSQSVDQDEASGKAKEYERLLRAFAGGMARSFKGAGTDGYSEGFCQQVNQICQNEKEPISKLAEGMTKKEISALFRLFAYDIAKHIGIANAKLYFVDGEPHLRVGGFWDYPYENQIVRAENPEHVAMGTSEIFEVRGNLAKAAGVERCGRGRYEEAIAYLESAEEDIPGDFEVARSKAFCNAMLGRRAVAIDGYKKAIALAKTGEMAAECLIELASVHVFVGNERHYLLAADCCMKSIEKNPKKPEAYNLLAAVLDKLGYEEEANKIRMAWNAIAVESAKGNP